MSIIYLRDIKMIDKIKNNLPPSTKAVNSAPQKASDVSATKQPPQTAQSLSAERSTELAKEVANKNNISQFVTKSKIKDMAKEPPIDKNNVSRIKNAIANGSYPVDLEKIADSLMDTYKEMK